MSRLLILRNLHLRCGAAMLRPLLAWAGARLGVAFGIRIFSFIFVCLAAQLLTAPAHAAPELVLAPQLTSLSHQQQPTSFDLRGHWEHALVSTDKQPGTPATDPQEVWGWPAERFSRAPSDQLVLQRGQRYVARLELVSPGAGTDMNLTFQMPRLDGVHVAYRYGGEPWVRAAAGDTVPMAQWPFADRQPSFTLPLRPGKLSLVVELAHIGVVQAPALLQNSQAFRSDRLTATLSTGVLIGINLVLAVVGLWAVWSFRRGSFIAITIMTLLMAAVVGANSGLAGVYLFADSAAFNDQVKFFTNTLWCVVFPWVTATVLSKRFHAVRWWRFALAWAGLGLLGTLWWMQYPLRQTAFSGVPLVALASTALALAILGNALLRGQAHAVTAAAGVVLYACALLLPLAAYLGNLGNDPARQYAALATMAAALVFLHALVRQHRQGSMVVSRARTAPGRDVLTGLLSRQGFEQVLARNIKRMRPGNGYAALFYIRVSNAQKLKEHFGDEGFEVGMVQVAAAISSSVSVVDSVGRVAPNAFAVTVIMPHEASLASNMAQKILGRIITLAAHGAPLAKTANIAVAWLPVYGTELPEIERLALRALSHMDDGKRIAWVGGAHAHGDSAILSDSPSSPVSQTHSQNHSQPQGHPHGAASDAAVSHPSGPHGLSEVITRLEVEMLGPSTAQLQAHSAKLAQLEERVRKMRSREVARHAAKQSVSQPG